jgi:hypothetical protein
MGIFANEIKSGPWHEALHNCPTIKIDNVVEYWYSSKLIGKPEDFPNIAPPFPNFFMEWSNVRHSTGPKSIVKKAGVCFWAMEVGDPRMSEDYKPLSPYFRWLVGSQALIQLLTGEFKKVPFVWEHLIDHNGQILSKDGKIFTVVAPTVKTIDVEQWADFHQIAILPCFLALSFMHCKNVRCIEVKPSEKLNKATMRRGNPPHIKYYTLEIDPMKKVLREEGQIETLGLKRALHITRGHFANYTEGKGLFGKYHGQFWIPQHVKGSASHGIIEKDYSIKAPLTSP